MGRANRTLQDRLVQEQRLAEIRRVEAGKALLLAFIERFNERFAVVPAEPDDLHRKVHLPRLRLTDILCHREQRYPSAQLSFQYDRRQIILERNQTSEGFAGKYVDLYNYTDGKLSSSDQIAETFQYLNGAKRWIRADRIEIDELVRRIK